MMNSYVQDLMYRISSNWTQDNLPIQIEKL